jgi:hypothetical protein
MRSLTLGYEVKKSPEIEPRTSKETLRVIPLSEHNLADSRAPEIARKSAPEELDVRRILFRGNPGYRAGKSAGEEDLK